jgi:hypothetical protein
MGNIKSISTTLLLYWVRIVVSPALWWLYGRDGGGVVLVGGRRLPDWWGLGCATSWLAGMNFIHNDKDMSHIQVTSIGTLAHFTEYLSFLPTTISDVTGLKVLIVLQTLGQIYILCKLLHFSSWSIYTLVGPATVFLHRMQNVFEPTPSVDETFKFMSTYIGMTKH